jgi:hypothetical protein
MYLRTLQNGTLGRRDPAEAISHVLLGDGATPGISLADQFPKLQVVLDFYKIVLFKKMISQEKELNLNDTGY